VSPGSEPISVTSPSAGTPEATGAPTAPGSAAVPGRLRSLAIVGLVVALGGGLLTLFATYRIWEQGSRDDARPAGAIVVLGAAQYDGRPSPVFAARLDHAIQLFEDGYAPRFVVTGGKQAGDRMTEAEAARDYAIARGVPAGAILMEDRGRTTLGSLDSVAAMLADRDVHDAIFVSDPTHMLRVLRIARDAGLTAWGSPTRTSPVGADPWLRLDATTHELGALAFYFFARVAPPGESAGPG
jgi:uncharacterized SAM-binding protein YcdF (DUF218 family)